MRFAPLFLLSFALSLFFVSSSPAQAATISSGDLIKASGPSVYYFGADNKRYVFPNEKTYQTWYSDFSGVQTITDSELATIMIGGNVTYRPGVKLVKVTTDPKVYAVARGGSLRWVPDEASARTLYGNNWAQNVEDLPDAFFVNYRVGEQISVANTFSPSSERDTSININTDKSLGRMIDSLPPLNPPTSTNPSTPSPTSTPSIPTSSTSSTPTNTPGFQGSVTVLNDNGQLSPGARLNILASPSPSGGIQSIRIFANNVSIQTCTEAPCSTTYLTGAATSSVIALRAEFTWLGGSHASASTNIHLIDNPAGDLVRVLVSPEVLPFQRHMISVQVNDFFDVATTVLYIDGVAVNECRNLQTCEYTLPTGHASGTHTVYAISDNGAGGTIQSRMMTFEVVSNLHPTLRITTNQSSVAVGGTVTVEVQGFDNDGVATTEISLDGTVLRRCNASSCQVTAGPWTQARTLQFIGHAQDTSGLDGYTSSTLVTVQ